MELQTKNPVTVERNHEASTFFFRLMVDTSVGCAYDFDGIFCEECSSSDKGSDDAYYKFLCTANPLFYPHKGHVDLIITGRHHKYRDITDKWLKRNSISYGQMVMRDFDIDPTDTATPIAEFKAGVYGKLPDYTLFVESRLKQAKLIHERTGKNVFCTVGRTFLTRS